MSFTRFVFLIFFFIVCVLMALTNLPVFSAMEKERMHICASKPILK
jgi:hypothetical protein